MSIIQALVAGFDGLETPPGDGLVDTWVSFAVVLDRNGSVTSVRDLRTTDGKRQVPRVMQLPQGTPRTSGIKPNTLWDKGSYLLGLPALDPKKTSADDLREQKEKADAHCRAFREFHIVLTDGETDPGMVAVGRFSATYDPTAPRSFALPDGADGQANFVFAFEDGGEMSFVHDRPAAKSLYLAPPVEGSRMGRCIVSGHYGPIADIHTGIKGVRGASSSGAPLVSFNASAFASHGWDRGENATMSKDVVFKYTTMLNMLLKTNRIILGETTVVYWVSSDDREASAIAEQTLAAAFGTSDNALVEKKIAQALASLGNLRSSPDLDGLLPPGSRLHILGLVGSKGRISVRFWIEEDFEKFVGVYRRFVSDLEILPRDRSPLPQLARLLEETAAYGKASNISPHLASGWARSILEGTRYPAALTPLVLNRLRANDDLNHRKVAILKSVLVRNHKMEVPVALDKANSNPGYLLGRLFAVLDNAQEAAVGKVGSTVKDKFYSSASAQPASTFKSLMNMYQRHIAAIRRKTPGLAHHFDGQVRDIMFLLPGGIIPLRLTEQDQAIFSVGYYHQRFTKTEKPEKTVDATEAKEELQ